jgi:hypothetical protein
MMHLRVAESGLFVAVYQIVRGGKLREGVCWSAACSEKNIF